MVVSVKPVIAVRVSALIGVKTLDIFKGTSGQFPAAFVVQQTDSFENTSGHLQTCSWCF